MPRSRHLSLKQHGERAGRVHASPAEARADARPRSLPAALADLKTNEELYLAGLKVEQFHDPSLDPDPFWEEALKRDPGDARVNSALGIRRLKQARYADAENHLRKAIARLTTGYATPRDGEPYYYLGLGI